MGGKAEVVEDIAYFLVIVSFIQAHPLRLCLCRFGPVYHGPRESRASQFHIMPIGSLDLHCNGHPMPLCKNAAFYPAFSTIGWVGTGFFSTQRSLGHGSIHAQPVPVQPMHLIKLFDSRLPQCKEDSCIHPCLKPIVRRRMRTQLCLTDGLPLAPGS